MVGGGKAYYVYDSAGQRVRKVWEKATGIHRGAHLPWQLRTLPSAHWWRTTDATARNAPHLGRQAAHRARGNAHTRHRAARPRTRPAHRYQLGNHLGSVSLELDNEAHIISYEEYTPYGNTSYQAVRSRTETPKRYRYTSKERDEENRLYYHGARYYAPWLGRWISTDPLGMDDGINLYSYASDRPLNYYDDSGLQKEDHEGLVYEILSLFVQTTDDPLAKFAVLQQSLDEHSAARRELEDHYKLGNSSLKSEGLKSEAKLKLLIQKESQTAHTAAGLGAQVIAQGLSNIGEPSLAVEPDVLPEPGPPLPNVKSNPPPGGEPEPFIPIPHEGSPSGAVIQKLEPPGPKTYNARSVKSGSINAGQTARPNGKLDPSRTQGFKGENPLPEGTSLRSWKEQGREFSQEWLKTFMSDETQPSHVRGWLKNEARRVEQGKTDKLKRPPGYVLGHQPGKRASEGFDYTNSTLVTEDINNLEVRAFMQFLRTHGRPPGSSGF